MEGSRFHSEWGGNALESFLDDQRDTLRELKAAKTKKPLPLAIVRESPSARGVLTTLFTRGRHFGSSRWLRSQKLSVISAAARVNFRFALARHLRDAREITALAEELSAIYPKRTVSEMYETAIFVEPCSFWFASLIAKSKRDLFVRPLRP